MPLDRPPEGSTDLPRARIDLKSPQNQKSPKTPWNPGLCQNTCKIYTPVAINKPTPGRPIKYMKSHISVRLPLVRILGTWPNDSRPASV